MNYLWLDDRSIRPQESSGEWHAPDQISISIASASGPLPSGGVAPRTSLQNFPSDCGISTPDAGTLRGPCCRLLFPGTFRNASEGTGYPMGVTGSPLRQSSSSAARSTQSVEMILHRNRPAT